MYGSIFIQICAVGSTIRIFSAPGCVLAVEGRSGSSKVDDFGTNRKCVCDFLLVRHCDYGPMLRRLWNMVTYWLKRAYFCYILLLLSHSAPSLPMFPLEFCGEVNHKENRVTGLSSCEDRVILAGVVLAWYQRDRRSDGRTVRRSDRQNLSWLIQCSA